MRFVFTLKQSDVDAAMRGVMQRLNGPQKRRVLYRMAREFYEITASNIGTIGAARPSEWPPLSPRYAKRVGRSHATMLLTGEMFRSIRVSATQDAGQISTTNPYAAAHQYGEAPQPLRPFMPMTGTQGNERLTPYAEKRLIDVAQAELRKLS